MSFTSQDLSRALVDLRVMSRRRFLTLAGGGAAALAAGPLVGPALAARKADPRPIRGGIGPFHVYPPAYKPLGPPDIWEQNTITDFRGEFCSADVTGWGVDQDGRELWFRCDMRAFRGEYIDVNGTLQKGAFGFI